MRIKCRQTSGTHGKLVIGRRRDEHIEVNKKNRLWGKII